MRFEKKLSWSATISATIISMGVALQYAPIFNFPSFFEIRSTSIFFFSLFILFLGLRKHFKILFLLILLFFFFFIPIEYPDFSTDFSYFSHYNFRGFYLFIITFIPFLLIRNRFFPLIFIYFLFFFFHFIPISEDLSNDLYFHAKNPQNLSYIMPSTNEILKYKMSLLGVNFYYFGGFFLLFSSIPLFYFYLLKLIKENPTK